MIENIGAYSQVDYDKGYQQGATDMEKAKQIIIDNLLRQIEQIKTDAIHEYISWLQDTRKIDMVVWKMLDDYADEFLKEQTNG